MKWVARRRDRASTVRKGAATNVSVLAQCKIDRLLLPAASPRRESRGKYDVKATWCPRTARRHETFNVLVQDIRA